MATRILGAGALGVGLLSAYCWKRRADQRVSVLSYNLLARPFTKYEKQHHRNPADKIETEAQTRERYSVSTKTIIAEKPHVVLLQECEPAYFNLESNKHADTLLAMYNLFPCFGRQPDGGISPSTAVLFLRDSAKALEVVPRCVGGDEACGGTSKTCTVVDATIHQQVHRFASCHFTFDGLAEKRRHHVDLLEPLMSKCQRLVVGGDFNAANESMNGLQRNSFLHDLDRPSLDAPLGTVSSEQKTIDHFFTRGFRVLQTACLHVAKCPYGEGVPAEIVGGSDHVPILVHLESSASE